MPTLHLSPEFVATLKNALDGPTASIANVRTAVNQLLMICEEEEALMQHVHEPRTLAECFTRYVVPSFKTNLGHPSTSCSFSAGPISRQPSDLASAMQPIFTSRKVRVQYLPDFRRHLFLEFWKYIRPNPATATATTSSSPLNPSTVAVSLDDDQQSLGEYQRALAAFIKTYWESHILLREADIHHEEELTAACRPLMAELVNRILGCVAAYNPAQRHSKPFPHWVAPKLERIPGITDWVCCEREVPKAVMEWKWLSDSSLDGLVLAAKSREWLEDPGRPHGGFEFSVQGERLKYEAKNLDENACEACLQTQMHHYKVRWGILLNTRNAIVAYLAGENTLYLSDVITRDAGKDFDSFTLTAAMYTLALTDWRPPTADFSVSFLDLKVEISQLKHQGEHSTAALRGRGNQGCGNRCGTTRASMFTAQRGSAGQQGQERDQDDTGRHDLLGDDCRQLSAFVRAVQAGQVFDRVKFETPATEASSSGSLNPAHLIICGPRPLGEGRAWTVFEGLLTFPNGSSSEMEITSLTVQVVNPRHLQGKLAAPTVPVRSTVIDTGAQALNDGAEDMTKGGYKSLCPSSLPAVSAAGAGDANASPPSELPAAKISPSSSWESRLDGSSLSLPTSLDKSDFSVSQQVAVKICCPRNRCGPYVEQEDLEDGVMWEGRLYDGPLRALQGNAVPHCYGLFSSADEEVFVMVQERLWGPMAESWAMVHDLQAQPVLDAFEALHRAGVLHQDLDPRHVQFASTEGHEGGYRLIDFNLALGPGEWTDEDREQEDRLLRNRLGLLRR